jgi:hypothetical protein
MNTVSNIDSCLSLNPKPFEAIISSPLQWNQALVNHLMTHMICPGMMKNSECHKNEAAMTPG